LGQDGGGNIDTNPLFVEYIDLGSSWPANDGDLHLQSGSPAINVGSAIYYNSSRIPDISGTTTDLDGTSLIHHVNGVKYIDMGAYQTMKTTPPVPPVPSVFTITIPDIKGVTTTPKAGRHEVNKGESFALDILVDDEYDESVLRVFANNKELEEVSIRSASYSYRIEEVYETITIRIEGVEKNDPLSSNSFSGQSAVRIYTIGTTLYAEVARKAGLAIYSSSGKLYTERNLEPGTTALTLPKGIYVVKIGEDVWKIMISD